MISISEDEYEKRKGGFWQVQSLVNQNTIRNFTKSCEQTDCKISARIVGGSTTMGYWNHYDKEGRLINTDWNQYKVSIFCSKCKRSALVDNAKDFDPMA